MDVLHHHLQFNGAHIIDSFGEKLNHYTPTSQSFYAIVPYKMPRSEIPSAEDMVVEYKIVTDMWLERCLEAKAIVPPESHVTSTPFPQFPIPGMSVSFLIWKRFSQTFRLPGNAYLLNRIFWPRFTPFIKVSEYYGCVVCPPKLFF
jgi:hypothetical protein